VLEADTYSRTPGKCEPHRGGHTPFENSKKKPQNFPKLSSFLLAERTLGNLFNSSPEKKKEKVGNLPMAPKTLGNPNPTGKTNRGLKAKYGGKPSHPFGQSPLRKRGAKISIRESFK